MNCILKCYDSTGTKIWKSKPIELFSVRYFNALNEARNIIGAQKIWVKFKENGIEKTIEVKFSPQKQKITVQSPYTGSDGIQTWTIPIRHLYEKPKKAITSH